MLVPNLFVANGVSSFAMNYLRHSNHKQVQFDFVSYQKGKSPYYKEIRDCGGEVYFVPPIRRLKSHIHACKRILNEGNYDIIHDNTLHISIPMMYCAKNCRIPVRILHSHNSKMGETKLKEIRNTLFMPVLKSFANRYVACSEVAGRSMFKEQQFQIVPNVIDTKKYAFDENRRREVREELNIEDKIIIGTVGRLAKQKNPLFALEIIKTLVNKMPQVEYWWIGDGPMKPEFMDYVKTHDLKDNVKHFENTTNVIDMYQAIDVYLMPSFFEGLPLTGVEAQAMGIPMVVSDTVTDEMVYTDLVKYISLNQTTDDWIEHIVVAIKKNIDRKLYTEELKKSKFADGKCGEQMMAIYKKMLNNCIV